MLLRDKATEEEVLVGLGGKNKEALVRWYLVGESGLGVAVVINSDGTV